MNGIFTSLLNGEFQLRGVQVFPFKTFRLSKIKIIIRNLFFPFGIVLDINTDYLLSVSKEVNLIPDMLINRDAIFQVFFPGNQNLLSRIPNSCIRAIGDRSFQVLNDF